MIDQLKTLQERLDQNYNSYLIQLRTKTADELIILAAEVQDDDGLVGHRTHFLILISRRDFP